MKSITIGEIENFFKWVLENLKDDKIDNVEVELDYYLIISASEGDLNNSPNPDVGSFYDDIAELRKAAQKKFLTYNDLDRLAILLIVISEIEAPTS